MIILNDGKGVFDAALHGNVFGSAGVLRLSLYMELQFTLSWRAQTISVHGVTVYLKLPCILL